MIQIAVGKSVGIHEHNPVEFCQEKDVKLFEATSIVTVGQVIFEAGKGPEDSTLSFPVFKQGGMLR